MVKYFLSIYVFIFFLQNGSLPQEWNATYNNNVFKKANTHWCGNHGPIILYVSSIASLLQELKTSYITNIFKKANRRESGNCKSIIVTNYFARIYWKIIKGRLKIKDIEEKMDLALDGNVSMRF